MKSRTNRQPSIGNGIYRLSEVARYAGIPSSTVRTWFGTASVFEADYVSVDDTHAVSFHDLIDALVAHKLRLLGVSMHTVRRAYRKLSVTLDTPHPFCHRGLYANPERIFVDLARELGDTRLQDGINNQGFFTFFKEGLIRVSYSVRTQLAERWKLRENVIIDPEIAFGAPVVDGTRIGTHIVYGAFRANNGDYGVVSRLYRMDRQKIKDAVAFEKAIRPAA